ncbi:MAG: 16S rRNA (adenine(1518)-N(6)/adenine(1519)-N(6))-dimethyltransferase RsmA [Planctomycetaceae bacterium]
MFQRHGFHPRHDLGQNFLIDINIIDFVIRNAELRENDVALEIGAGTGGLTDFLAQDAGHVVSVELDRNMHALATETITGHENVTLLNTDALKNKNNFSPTVLDAVNEALAAEPGRQLKLIANLPYSIATPVISNLVATNLPWERMVVTIQYELGLRMTAKPKTSHYGSLAVWLQSQCKVTMLKKLPPTVFWPRPKVDSAIMLIEPDLELRAAIPDREFFHNFVRMVFQHRRKLLRGVLAGMYRDQIDKARVDTLLEEVGFGEGLRAEEIDIPSLVKLATHIQRSIS